MLDKPNLLIPKIGRAHHVYRDMGIPLWRPEGLVAQRQGSGLTWDIDVHRHDAVTAPHDGV